jgi:signal transduction histidine kinase
MTEQPRPQSRRSPGWLLTPLRWIIRLRWLAAASVIAGTLINQQWLHWFGHSGAMLAVGGVIAVCNGVHWIVLRSLTNRLSRRLLLDLSLVAILLDLACLTLLTLWSGGALSPLLGFFVFHMVVASLLLPRMAAYGGAGVSVVMVTGGLWLTDQLPDRLETQLLLGGWIITLVLTVYLASRIMHSLRRQSRRLAAQNRRIRAMTSRLRQQHATMIQHEKMVALGQMAAGIAHEITNPLASMDGLLQLLERHPGRDRSDAIGTLRQQVNRIGRIIRQMTLFTHPSQGEWQTVELSDVAERALEMVQLDRRLADIPIDRHYAPQGCRVWAQPLAMQQVLVNLLINALDAMESQKSPRLEISTTHGEDYSAIEVRDNGHGIQKADLDRVFEPFFTTKPVGKGTGLGLSISYNLIREHGGRIEVVSEPGKGTTFTVLVPCRPSTGLLSENPSRPARAADR